MTEDRLSELLNEAVPPLGPALDSGSVLAKARRRQAWRRRTAVLATMGLVVAGSVGIAVAVGGGDKVDQSSSGQPCSSPFAGSDQEQSVSYPTGGKTVRITLKVNEHFTAAWHFCGEHGTSTSTGPQDGTQSPIEGMDISIYSSPRPVPSGQHGFQRPPEDGVFNVRYVAQRPGTVTLHGKGNLGSDGYIEVTVLPLDSAESREVSGTVATTGALPHTLVFYERSRGQGYADVHGDGTFSLRLRPGSYQATDNNHCTANVKVGDSDIHGVVVACTDPESTPGLVPVDPGGPAAAACVTDPAAIAIVKLNPDTPQPRCLSVRRGQRLRIVNSTNSFGQTGVVITITLRGFAPQTLQPGDGYTFPKALSDVLAPGYHRTTGGPHGDAQLLVES